MAYSDKEKETILNTIFKDIENGDSLRKALIKVGISSQTFYIWIEAEESKSKQYARACEDRAEFLLDEMIDIVDDSTNDIIETDIGDGIINTRVNSEVIQRSRLRYDARKWLISKLNPKKFGDKVDIDVTTKGESLKYSDEEREKRIAKLMAKK